MKKLYTLIIAISSVIISIFMCIFLFKPLIDSGKLIDVTFDKNLNIYNLNYINRTGEYQILKVDENGSVKKSKKLDQPSSLVSYDKIGVDNSGNIIIKMTEKSEEIDNGARSIKNEKILLYDTDMNFSKELVNVDFSSRGSLPKEAFIFDYQIVGNKVSIFCRDGNNYEILGVNTSESSAPITEQKFSIIPDANVSADEKWISDMLVSSEGRVVYCNYRGEIYLSDKGVFKNITKSISENEIIPKVFSIDENDNIYFTDALNMNFYQINLKSLMGDTLYGRDSVVNAKKNISFNDIKHVTYVNDGTFYGMLETTSNTQYVSFGGNENCINRFKGNNIIIKVLVFIVTSVVLFFLVYGIARLIIYIKNLKSLSIKVIVKFLPVYVLAMGIACIVLIYTIVNEHTDDIALDQINNSKLIADTIDGDMFKTINTNGKYYTDEFLNISDQIEAGYKKSEQFSNVMPDVVIAYVVKDGVIYSNYIKAENNTFYIKDIEINFGNLTSSIYPIEYNLNKKLVEQYYSVWDNINSGNDNLSLLVSDYISEWVSGITPVYDSSGKAVGFIESKVDKWQYQDLFFYQVISIVLSVFIFITALIVVYFVFILKRSLSPLKEINKCVREIGEGKWNTKVNITSKDELADIGKGFNIMTDKINQYVSSFVSLSQEYLKFVPSGLFKLLGKSKISEISLGDRGVNKISILSVNFDVKEENYLTFSGIDDYFQGINQKYARLFDMVKANNGVVEKFDAFGMTVIFPDNAFDAVSASMQFVDQLTEKSAKNNFRIGLGTANATVGVMGNNSRMSITVMSEELMLMEYVSGCLSKMKISHFAMQSMIDEIQNNSGFNNYRFVGQIKHPKQDKPIKIYEFINAHNLYERKLYLGTKSLFERAVNDYIEGNLAEARKTFSSILKINESDKMAMYYLGICDKLDYKTTLNWKGYILD